MMNVQAMTSGLPSKHLKLNNLVTSTRPLTLNLKGQDEIIEGHYYARQEFINDPMPLLRAKDAGKEEYVSSRQRWCYKLTTCTTPHWLGLHIMIR